MSRYILESIFGSLFILLESDFDIYVCPSLAEIIDEDISEIIETLSECSEEDGHNSEESRIHEFAHTPKVDTENGVDTHIRIHLLSKILDLDSLYYQVKWMQFFIQIIAVLVSWKAT